MKGRIGIAGAGLFGRLTAFRLAEEGYSVTLFDRDTAAGGRSCAHTGAGMLAPLAELEKAEPLIAALGWDAIPLWKRLLARLEAPVFFQQSGSLAVAHGRDREELDTLEHTVKRKTDRHPERVDSEKLAVLEPELAGRFEQGLFFPGEAQLEPRDLLPALARALRKMDAEWFEEAEVTELDSGRIRTGTRQWRFDWALDARGMGAKPDLPRLRGVRGELLRVHAPEVGLQRPVRLMHPRYPLYIVPRAGHNFLIGATSIESEDYGPVTVKSCLELLSAAYSVHPGFAEAGILEASAQCRPALPDNLPSIFHAPGLIRVNGLYRHGFLIAPTLAEEVNRLIAGEPLCYPTLLETR